MGGRQQKEEWLKSAGSTREACLFVRQPTAQSWTLSEQAFDLYRGRRLARVHARAVYALSSLVPALIRQTLSISLIDSGQRNPDIPSLAHSSCLGYEAPAT